MLTRLIEMVSFILAKSIDSEDDEWGDLRHELTEQLEGKGFNDQEIDIAFEVANRIRSRLEEGTSITIPYKTNLVYQQLEKMKLTKTARGYLLMLLNQGVISPEQREEIVERAYFMDIPEVDTHEIQYLVNYVIGGDSWPGEDSPSMSYSIN